MFKISVSPSYVAPVNVDILGDDGTVQNRVLMCRFKRLSQKEIDDLHEQCAKGLTSDAKVISEVLLGWTENPLDENGNPMEFNPENLAKVLDIYPTRPSVARKFFETIQGARAKNL